MVNAFISHSKRDKKLVEAINTALKNIGIEPVIVEFIPQEEREHIPHELIAKKVEKCEIMFLFLTDNIVKTEYTKNWVMFEIGLAKANRMNLYVFERAGLPIPYPIPYLTHYAIFKPNDIKEILFFQTIALEAKTFLDKTKITQTSSKKNKFKKFLLTISVQILNLLEILDFYPGLFQLFLTLLSKPKGEMISALKISNPTGGKLVNCNNPKCNAEFIYCTPRYREFYCPICRKRKILIK